MTPDEIINELATSAAIPREALRAGVGVSESLRPRIVELARKVVDGVWLLPDDRQLLTYGLHVLAAAGDKPLWPVLRGILSLPEEEIESLVGDGAAEAMTRLILSVWDGEEAGILEPLTAPGVAWQARWALFRAAARLACDGAIDRAKVEAALERFEREGLAPDDSFAWLGWEDAVAHLGLTGLVPALERAWSKSAFSDYRDVDRAETLDVLKAAAADPNDPHELIQDRIMPIDDPVEAVEWLERQNEFGRDDDDEAVASGAGPASLRSFELEWLAGFLVSRQVPDSTMSLEMLDGFYTALVAGPDVVRPSAYLDAIWGGDKDAVPVFDSEEQARYVMDLMMRRWNEIADGLMAGEPATPIVMDYGDDLTGRDWADGFLSGVEHHEGLSATPKLLRRTGEMLEPILSLTGEGERIGAVRRARILDELPQMILRCARLWRPDAIPGAATGEPLRSAKVGRNEACPCGSGKKFKKCCGAGGG